MKAVSQIKESILSTYIYSNTEYILNPKSVLNSYGLGFGSENSLQLN